MVVAAQIDGETFEPLRDTLRPVGPADLVRVAGDPEEPMPTRGDGFLVRELDVDAVAGVIADLAPAGLLEVRLLGGALARASEGHGVLGSLDAPYSVFAGGPVTAGLDERLAEIRARLAEWAAPRELLSAAALGADPAQAFGAEWERLQRVRSANDPERRIVTTHDGA
jgi:hypothetical protein